MTSDSSYLTNGADETEAPHQRASPGRGIEHIAHEQNRDQHSLAGAT